MVHRPQISNVNSLIAWLVGGMVFSAAPLEVGRAFCIRIDKILSCWCGSIEIGVIVGNPEAASHFPSASSIETSSWVLSGEHVYKNSHRCVGICEGVLHGHI